MKPNTRRAALTCCVLLTATACGRVSEATRVPSMTEPHATPEFQAMAEPVVEVPGRVRPDSAASLWAGQQTSLVGDRRAKSRGDILTVVIEIDDKAEIQNSSGRSRSASDSVGIPQMIGIPQRADEVLPAGASFGQLASAKGSSTYKGAGNISRRDKITLRVAATVIEKLPNGVLHIEGSQQVRVNYEVRDLTISGFVRPSDIDRSNEVSYDRVAGARISYGGHGQISDVQQPRYGQQLADIVLPY